LFGIHICWSLQRRSSSHFKVLRQRQPYLLLHNRRTLLCLVEIAWEGCWNNNCSLCVVMSNAQLHKLAQARKLIKQGCEACPEDKKVCSCLSARCMHGCSRHSRGGAWMLLLLWLLLLLLMCCCWW
jgi:hypothetical protein